MNVDFERVCVCGDDVKCCDWSLEGIMLLVSRWKEGRMVMVTV